MSVRFGRRMRRRVAGTAVAAAAMAALTASQAPGLTAGPHHATEATPPPGTPIDGGSPYITNLPPLNSPSGKATPGGTGTGTGVGPGGAGIPATVLAAYRNAETILRRTRPGCHLPWQLLAAIGQVESDQAEHGAVDASGTTLRPILGPALDGSNGYARIPDGNGGYDRAIGPMQFIPSTWAVWGADGNGDGVKDPNNVFDAALAAGDYLCAVGGDMSVPADMDRAILGYNHSQDYLNTVKAWYQYYLTGYRTVPDSPGAGAPGTGGALPTAGPSPSATTGAGGPSGAPSGGPSASPSRSPQPTVSASGTIGPGPSGSPTTGPKPSPSGSASGCPTTSPSPSGSTSPTPTGSPSPSPSPSASASPSPSGSPSASPSGSPSGSPSPSPSGTCGVPSPHPSTSKK